VSATIPVGGSPFGVAATPDGSKVYVANDSVPGTVSVIDTTTNTVVGSTGIGLQIVDSASPVGVAVAPDGSKVYVATVIRTGRGSAGVSVIDTTTNAVITTIPVFRSNTGVAVTPDGGKVYVTTPLSSRGRSTVSVIDTTTNTVSTAIVVGAGSAGVAVTPDGSKVYVASSISNTVSVIDTTTNMVGATIPVGSSPFGVAVTPDGSKVYVANEGSNTVSVIETATNTVIGSPIPVGDQPVAFGLFIQPALKFAGLPGAKNCHGTSVSALATKFGGLNAAAAALGFSDVQGLQDAIRAFCGG